MLSSFKSSSTVPEIQPEGNREGAAEKRGVPVEGMVVAPGAPEVGTVVEAGAAVVGTVVDPGAADVGLEGTPNEVGADVDKVLSSTKS